MIPEKSKEIPNFPGYFITTDGQIWSEPKKTRSKGRFLKPNQYKNKYFYVPLYKKGKAFWRTIHRLVLETYICPCPLGMQCRHLNGIRTDNRLENLRWGTYRENRADCVKHGSLKGERNGNAKLTDIKAKSIFEMYQSGLFSQRKLAKLYNVDQRVICNVVNKKSWKHIWR